MELKRARKEEWGSRKRKKWREVHAPALWKCCIHGVERWLKRMGLGVDKNKKGGFNFQHGRGGDMKRRAQATGEFDLHLSPSTSISPVYDNALS